MSIYKKKSNYKWWFFDC